MNGKREPGNALVGAVIDASKELSGAASILDMLEEKVEVGGAVSRDELAAVRRIVKACAESLDAAWSDE